MGGMRPCVPPADVRESLESCEIDLAPPPPREPGAWLRRLCRSRDHFLGCVFQLPAGTTILYYNHIKQLLFTLMNHK
jgi:hypothetical protein